MATKTEQLQRTVRYYREDGNRGLQALGQSQRGSSRKICGNRSQKLWSVNAPNNSPVALGEEYTTDPQGRRVRTKHSARVEKDGEQIVLWDDIRTASRSHMRIAFQQRRQQIVGDCHQLSMDMDSFNQNQNPSHPIQLSFDFTRDLEELLAVVQPRDIKSSPARLSRPLSTLAPLFIR